MVTTESILYLDSCCLGFGNEPKGEIENKNAKHNNNDEMQFGVAKNCVCLRSNSLFRSAEQKGQPSVDEQEKWYDPRDKRKTDYWSERTWEQ